MKILYVNLLRLCVVTFFLAFDSCRPKTQDNVAPNTTNSSTYYRSFLLKNNTPLGLAITDTIQREIVLGYGDKNTQGKLITINQIAYWRKDKDVIFVYKFTDDYLPSAITAITNKTNVQVTFNKYDLVNGSVNVTLTNLTLNQEKISNQSLPLDASILTKLKYLQSTGQAIKSKGRLAANANGDCSELSSYTKSALSVASCLVSIYALAGPEGAILTALGPETFGITFGILILSEIGTVTSCIDAVVDSKKSINGECDDQGDLPKGLLDCAIGTFSAAAKFNLTKEVEVVTDCLGPIANALRVFITGLNPNSDITFSSLIGGAFGDPHLQTFDGLYYDFQGYGEFVAVKSLTDNFEIQVRQEQVAPYLNRQVTLHTGIAINTGNDKVCVYPDMLYVNNRGYTLGDGFVALTKGSVSTSNGIMTIVSDNEDVIKINIQSFSSAYIDYKVTLNSNRKGKVKGLLGNFDGMTTNDTQLQSGGTVNPSAFSELYPAYADSWRISQDKSLFVYSNGTNTTTYTKKDFPKSQAELDAVARQQAETICRQKGVTDEPYLSACIMDVAFSGSDRYTVSAIGAQESKSVINNFTITKFTSFDGLDLIPFGNAEIVDGELYLTKASSNQAGAIYKKYKADISNGFETAFDFSMTQPGGIADAKNRVGGDGMAFIIQDNSSTSTPILGGLSMPYNGLPRSLAIEFDTFDNLNYGLKEGPNDIWLNTQGINRNSANDDITLIKPQTLPLPSMMNDGKIHHVVIRYTKKSDGVYKLEMFYDNGSTAYLTADNINIQKIIGAYSSGIYMGFVASTGAAWENHIISNWAYKPL